MSDCKEHDFFWYGSPHNEAGWRCCYCKHKPGEPPGFDPNLDRKEIERKAWCILNDLVEANIVYVSNGSQGDGMTAMVADACNEANRFDSYTIARMLLQNLTPGHAEYWSKVSEAILAGKDTRNRCRCGALATCSSSVAGGGWVHRCREHFGEI